ncbi:hypothetical protein ACLOJK_024699 [Asimina triloba]
MLPASKRSTPGFEHASREGFFSQIQQLSSIERETSITINRAVDLGKVALHIAAEDDALVSHSSVLLPVDSFIERLDDLAMGFCSLYIPPAGSSPELFLGNLERYFYVHKNYIPHFTEVLTRRSGSAPMLSLIYSEMLKMLRLCGFLDFDAEIYFPHDAVNLPRGYHKHKSKVSDEPHIVTVESLLAEILRNLKDVYWPFKYDHTGSLFLRAAQAANCVGLGNAEEGLSKSNNNTSGLEFASAKAAQHRLGRGVWTSVNFGDMRRALAACERLILLESDPKELRDYSVLLYHCGFYKESLQTCEPSLTANAIANSQQGHGLCPFKLTISLLQGEILPANATTSALRSFPCTYNICSAFPLAMQLVDSNSWFADVLPRMTKNGEQRESSLSASEKLEEDAVKKLMVRLNLISMEDGWTKSMAGRKAHNIDEGFRKLQKWDLSERRGTAIYCTNSLQEGKAND